MQKTRVKKKLKHSVCMHAQNTIFLDGSLAGQVDPVNRPVSQEASRTPPYSIRLATNIYIFCGANTNFEN